MVELGVIESAETWWAAPKVTTRKEGRIPTFFLKILEVKFRYCTWFISGSENGCVHRPAGRLTKIRHACPNCGYFQVTFDYKDRYKTAFKSLYGLVRLSKMRFKLCNAFGTFQRTMDMILSLMKLQFDLVYFNSTIILENEDKNVHMFVLYFHCYSKLGSHWM